VAKRVDGKSSLTNTAAALLVSTLTDLVAEMIEAKCATLNARERDTLERRIGKAVDLFVQGMQLTPAQRRERERQPRRTNASRGA
jgi:hypothetical protein